jgi:hypothetical protein
VAGEQAVYKLLAGSSNVTNEVGSRIYGGGVAPQDASLPYVTIQVVGDHDRQLSISGATGLAAKRIQVNCVAVNYNKTVDIASATRRTLHGASGAAGAETVRAISMDNELDVPVSRVEGGDKYLYVKVQDYIVWVDEATT